MKSTFGTSYDYSYQDKNNKSKNIWNKYKQNFIKLLFLSNKSDILFCLCNILILWSNFSN